MCVPQWLPWSGWPSTWLHADTFQSCALPPWQQTCLSNGASGSHHFQQSAHLFIVTALCVPELITGSGPPETLCLDCSWVSSECFSIRDGVIHVFFFFPVLKTTFIEYLFCVKLCAKCCKLVSSFSLCKIWGNTTAVFPILQIKNWGSEKLVHLSKATQLWRDRVRFTPRQVLQSLCSQLWVP